MNRASFLKNIVALFGAVAMPKNLDALIIAKTQKAFLAEYFIRGFKYYAGPQVLKLLKQGAQLLLVREPANEYDNFAIAVYFEDLKLGFIPAEENELLARLIDSEAIDFYCELLFKNEKANPWEAVYISVYTLTTKLDLPDTINKPFVPVSFANKKKHEFDFITKD